MYTTICGRLFPSPSQAAHIKTLMRLQSSAMRSAYRYICQQTTKSQVERHLAKRYPLLNSRYYCDGYNRAKTAYESACTRVSEGLLTDPRKLIFGTRKNFHLRACNKLSHQDWQQRRNNQLYSRGDRSSHGNLNLRFLLLNDELVLRINIGYRKWIYVPAYLPKLPKVIMSGLLAYSVRILMYVTDFDLRVTVENQNKPIVDFHKGAVGVDFNHDTIDLAVLNHQGQLRATRTFLCHDLTCARRGKRAHRLGNLVKQVVAYASYWGRGLVLEDLRDVARGRSNQDLFLHRQFLEAVSRRAEKQGVMVRWVNPAYTSVIGAWKYTPYYNITVHQAAALVIARRGQGFSEPLRRLKTLVFKPMEGSDTSEYVLGRRVHAWSLWQRIQTLPLHKGALCTRPDHTSCDKRLGSRGPSRALRLEDDDTSDREIVIPGSGPPIIGVKKPHNPISRNIKV